MTDEVGQLILEYMEKTSRTRVPSGVLTRDMLELVHVATNQLVKEGKIERITDKGVTFYYFSADERKHRAALRLSRAEASEADPGTIEHLRQELERMK